MGIKFYRRSHPTAKLFLDDGAELRFTSLDGNVTGYFATDVEGVQNGLATMIREGRGGVTEIDAETFNRDYIEKKKQGQSLPPLWREELANGQMRRSASDLKARLDAVAPSVAVVNPERPAPVAQTVADTNQAISAALPAASKPFTPPVGSRKAKKAPPTP